MSEKHSPQHDQDFEIYQYDNGDQVYMFRAQGLDATLRIEEDVRSGMHPAILMTQKGDTVVHYYMMGDDVARYEVAPGDKPDVQKGVEYTLPDREISGVIGERVQVVESQPPEKLLAVGILRALTAGGEAEANRNKKSPFANFDTMLKPYNSVAVGRTILGSMDRTIQNIQRNR